MRVVRNRREVRFKISRGGLCLRVKRQLSGSGFSLMPQRGYGLQPRVAVSATPGTSKKRNSTATRLRRLLERNVQSDTGSVWDERGQNRELTIHKYGTGSGSDRVMVN